MIEPAKSTLDIIATNYGDDAQALAKKLCAHAWLEGWIAALEHLKSKDPLHAPINPYIED